MSSATVALSPGRQIQAIGLMGFSHFFSHFYMFDVEGPDHVALMEWLCAARIGGDGNIGKGIYTHFLDDASDADRLREVELRCRVVRRRGRRERRDRNERRARAKLLEDPSTHPSTP